MLALLSAMFIWGTLGAFALWSGLSAIELAFGRSFIGCVLLVLLLLSKKQLSFKRVIPQDLFYAVLAGVCIVLNWVLLFKSFQLASITIGNVSYYLQPVFLVILGIVFFREQVSRAVWLAIAVTTLGVVFTSDLSLEMLRGGNAIFQGVLCSLSAGLLYAFATIFVKYIKSMPETMITLVQLIVGIVLLFPMVSMGKFLQLSSLSLINLLVIGSIHTALAYILYYRSLKSVNITLVAVASYLDPIVAILTDILFFNRQLHWLQIVGIFLTFIGSYFVIKRKIIDRRNKDCAITPLTDVS